MKIEYVNDPEYRYERADTVLIELEDGRAILVKGHSHEDVDLDWQTFDAPEIAAWRREQSKIAQGRRERDRVRRLTEAARLAKKERHIAEMKAVLPEREFLVWLDATYGLSATDKIIRDVYVDALRSAMEEQSVLLRRQVWGE